MVWEGNSCVAARSNAMITITDTTYIDTPHSFGLRMGMGMKMKMMKDDYIIPWLCWFLNRVLRKGFNRGSCLVVLLSSPES
jgi:hypothetical protein